MAFFKDLRSYHIAAVKNDQKDLHSSKFWSNYLILDHWSKIFRPLADVASISLQRGHFIRDLLKLKIKIIILLSHSREPDFVQGGTVGPIGQKALNKVVSHTESLTLLWRYQTLPDATRRYQTLPDTTSCYQMLTDVIRLSNPTVFRTNLGNSES
jgi:hypothetical protein